MARKHMLPLTLDSRAQRARDADSVKAAMELLKNGTAHMEATSIPSVSDAVGSKLCGIGCAQQTLTGNRSGNTVAINL